MLKFFSLIFLCLFTLSVSIAQNDIAGKPILTKVGVTAGIGLNQHNAEFENLSGRNNCCSQYNGGSGIGPGIGAFVAFPILDRSRLMIRLGYDDLNGEMIEQNTISDRTLVSADNAVAEFTLDAVVTAINASVEYEYNAFDNFNLYGGGRFGYLISGEVLTYERLVSPNDASYVVNNEFRNIRGDQFNYYDIPELNPFQAWIGGGVGYSIPVSDIFLEPFARYYFPITDIATVAGDNGNPFWSVATLSFGVDAFIEIKPEKEIIEETIYVRDTTLIVEAGISENIELINSSESITEEEFDDRIVKTITITESYNRTEPLEYEFTADIDGNYRKYGKIVIEETETKEAFPLLPYVFFGSGSSDLSTTSQNILPANATTSFEPLDQEWNVLAIHSNLLNIIGKRMLNNPGSDIVLTGTNNAIGDEQSNLELSRNRAEAVKSYLVNNWGIDPSRIGVEARNLPASPGRKELPEGQAENSRVEIVSTNQAITGYLNLEKIDITSNPPSVDIYSKLDHGKEGIDYTYSMEIMQEGQFIRKIDGQGDGDVSQNYTWNIAEEPRPKLEKPIDFKLAATDEYGVEATDSDQILLEQMTIRKKREILKNDKIVEKYSLIVFEYNSAELTPLQKANLKTARNAINPNSRVVIDGYTDNIGSPEYNLDLSKRRIEEVVSTLGLVEGDNVESIERIPHGAQNPLYDNKTAKGRSYNRTVVITILNPVE
jgi:outer membrane protein OmpA-like peptidoglycan-associated protein